MTVQNLEGVKDNNDKQRRFLGSSVCLAVITTALLLAGCASCFDIGEIGCSWCPGSDHCYEEGAVQCSDDREYIQECVLHESGCLYWENVTPCYDRQCIYSNGHAVCGGCYWTNLCDTPGETRCNGTVVQECLVDYDDEDCSYWSDVEDCADEGMTCLYSEGSAHCFPGCDNACSDEGETRCSGSIVQICSMGEDDCLSWTDSVDCSDYGLECMTVSGSGRCTHPYPSSEYRGMQAYWEQFGPWSVSDYTRDPVDVSGHSIVFMPDPVDPSAYTMAVFSGATEFPVAPGTGAAGGTLSGSDGLTRYFFSVMDRLTFFNQDYSDVMIDPHGAVLFSETGELDPACAADFFVYPKIAGFLTGALSLAEGGTVIVDEFIDTLCITYEDVPVHGADIKTSFQIIIDAGGIIELHYLAVDTFPEDRAIVGIFNGGNVGSFPPETDFVPCSTQTWCDLPEGFWEMFTDSIRSDYPDVAGHEVIFTPDPAGPNGYSWSEMERGANFPVIPGQGDASTVLPLHDVEYIEYPFSLMESFNFFETAYSSMFVCSNGSITFGQGDGALPLGLEDFFYFPRIGGFISELDYTADTRVTVDEFSDKVAVTYDHVFAAGGSSAGSFQIVMDLSGTIGLYYTKIPEVAWSLMGIFNGGSLGTMPFESDFVPCFGRPWCQPLDAHWESLRPEESDGMDINNHSILFTPLADNPSIYFWEAVEGTSDFPFLPGSGAASQTLTIPDDGFLEVPLGVLPNIEFYGLTYSSLFVSEDGYVTFNEGMAGVPENIFSLPLVAGFMTDFQLQWPGSIMLDEFSDAAVVTFDHVTHSGTLQRLSFQISFDRSGVIGLHYVDVDLAPSGTAMIGITNAGRTDRLPDETDFIPPPVPEYPASFQGYWEAFSEENPSDISGHTLAFIPFPEDPNGYTWTVMGDLTRFSTEPGSGNRSTLIPFPRAGPEAFHEYAFGVMDGFPLFDAAFTSFIVSSYGSIIFRGTDLNPRVNAFHAPFQLTETGVVFVDEFSMKTAVTFTNLVLTESPCRTNSFQVIFHERGKIELHYLMIDRSAAGEIGLSNGLESETRPAATDFVD